nr:MAG TPA: hypothetical protein [Caudoviricetes sp.]
MSSKTQHRAEHKDHSDITEGVNSPSFYFYKKQEVTHGNRN